MASVECLDADWLLEQWVRWVRYESGGGKPALANMIGKGMVSPIIDDEQALAIDGVVAQLLKTKPTVGGMVCSYYGHGRNYCAVADIFDADRKTVKACVAEGVGWVDAKLDNHCCLDRVRRVFRCLRRGEDVGDADAVTAELVNFFKKAS